MTVSNTTASITYTGNGSQTAFGFNFEVPYQADGVTPAVGAFKTVSGVETPLVLDTDYSITGVGSAFPDGGTVTYPLSGSPLASPRTITIYRALDLVQPYAFPNLGFRPDQVEAAFDTMVFMIQQLEAEIAVLQAEVAALS